AACTLAGVHERDLDVVPLAEVDEDGRLLELAAYADPDHVVLGEREEIGVVAEDHAPVLGLRPPGDHVEQRRLARAVRADDHAQLAAVHVEVQARERLEAVVGDGHVLEIDDGAGGGHARLRAPAVGVAVDGARPVSDQTRAAARARAPTTPSGKNSTTPMKRPPRNSSQTSG